jgi:3-phenylpropionate/cinnamic acid dioxygenase small subunit
MPQPVQVATSTELHNRLQLFYAEQMQLLDAGASDAWAATFAEDGVFAANGLPAPVRGRETIAAAARAAAVQRAEAGIVHRHWLGMLTVNPDDDGLVRTRCYALVIEIPRGGTATIHRSTVCTDVLVPAGDSWLVRDRSVTRDDIG